MLSSLTRRGGSRPGSRAYDPPKKILVPNIIGPELPEDCLGRLTFDLGVEPSTRSTPWASRASGSSSCSGIGPTAARPMAADASSMPTGPAPTARDARLQPRLQPAVRVHAVGDLSVTAAAEQAGDGGYRGREDLRERRALRGDGAPQPESFFTNSRVLLTAASAPPLRCDPYPRRALPAAVGTSRQQDSGPRVPRRDCGELSGECLRPLLCCRGRRGRGLAPLVAHRVSSSSRRTPRRARPAPHPPDPAPLSLDPAACAHVPRSEQSRRDSGWSDPEPPAVGRAPSRALRYPSRSRHDDLNVTERRDGVEGDRVLLTQRA